MPDWFCAESCNDLFVLSEPVSVITGFRFNTCSTVPIYSKHYIFVRLGSVPFFFLDENVEGGGEVGFSVPQICSAGALKEGFECFLSCLFILATLLEFSELVF